MNGARQIGLQESRHGRRGQALIFATLTMPVFIALTGVVIDFGNIYRAQGVLNASTQAAALAGANAMAASGATTTTVTSAVTTYSSQTGQENVSSLLSNASLVSGYPALSCISSVNTALGLSCYGPSSSNVIVVKQQASVPLLFLRWFGAGTVKLTSTATAAMKGAASSPYNVAIIVDTTASMNNTDSDSNCNSTRISCALSGVQVLLKTLSPCAASKSSCGTVTSGNVTNSVDRASLFVFPPVTTGTVANDYSCNGKSITTAAYASPFPSTSTYQVVGFSSDYRTSDSATSLNTSSNLVDAVAGPKGTPCLQVVGGYGTYLAQAITTAQAALVTEQKSFSGSQNVLIILSDGDANATSQHMPGASTTSGTYMSTIDQCEQAIVAAQAAATAGTRVYSVAYGAAASGCSTDASSYALTPCKTMQKIASSSNYFFSDYTATGGSSSCISASQSDTNLNKIFQVIASDLTVSKLIPNGTT